MHACIPVYVLIIIDYEVHHKRTIIIVNAYGYIEFFTSKIKTKFSDAYNLIASKRPA